MKFYRVERFLIHVCLTVFSGMLLARFLALPVSSQVSPDEHASHHPSQTPVAPAMATPEKPGAKPDSMPGMPVTTPQKTSPSGGMGGMGAMMQDMMKKMMGGGQKEIYPSLMPLPGISQAKRLELQKQAEKRAKSGEALLQQGVNRMLNPAANDLELQEGAADARAGFKQLSSGQASRRALAEGKPPRAVALEWFQPEMNLQPRTNHSLFSDMSFHILVIAILSTFVVAMLGMYFFKMRRAASLLERMVIPSTGSIVAPPAAGAHVTAAPPLRWKGVLRVARIFEETPNVKTFRLMSSDGGLLPFTYLPGQFASVTVVPKGKRVTRSYTIASSPTERDFMELTVKREEFGVVSGHLNDHVREGDLLEIAAPSGRFTFDGKQADCIAFIAGGVGITPMISAIRFLTARTWPGEMYLIYSCGSQEDIIFRDELEYLQRRNPNLHIFISLSQKNDAKWTGLTGRLTKEVIAKSVPEIASRHVHVCGPPPFMDAVKQMLADLGVPKEQVDTETFQAPPKEGAPEPENAEPVASPTDGTASSATPVAGTPSVLQVTFSKSGKSAPMPPDKSVLEASEDIGVNIPFECRVGTCGVCKSKLVSGTVTMAVEDALEPGEKEKGIILACQAMATSELVVDA